MNTCNISRYVEIGWKDQYWYEECERCFVELFGREKLWLISRCFAATSISTSLKSNITLFRKALYEIQNDLPVGKYLPNIQKQLQYIREGRELSGRKIRNFAAAMSGDPDAVVVDIWLSRAFELPNARTERLNGKIRNRSPTDREYTEIEDWIRLDAMRRGVQPRQLSAMIWSGVRVLTNGDRETHYQNLLRYHLTNLFGVI